MTTHGFTRKTSSPLQWKAFKAWAHMLTRCFNPNYQGRANYLDRGITVCDRWRASFENFIEDMGLPPTLAHTLHREDNDGNYEPTNCVWATRRVQQNETRQTIKLTWGGRTQSITQWAEEIGIDVTVLRARRQLGWSTERILTTPKQKHSKDLRAKPGVDYDEDEFLWMEWI